jgi:hypothetical protein
MDIESPQKTARNKIITKYDAQPKPPIHDAPTFQIYPAFGATTTSLT